MRLVSGGAQLAVSNRPSPRQHSQWRLRARSLHPGCDRTLESKACWQASGDRELCFTPTALFHRAIYNAVPSILFFTFVLGSTRTLQITAFWMQVRLPGAMHRAAVKCTVHA